MKSKINVGLFGCGRIARLVHLNILRNHPNLVLSAVAESDRANREKASALIPDSVFVSDYRELIARPDIDAVIICLPNSLHAEAAVAAFEHGKHVYLEKPVALNTKEAGKVVKAWKESNRIGMMGFNYRFNPLYESLGEIARSGVIGSVSHVRTVFSSSGRELPYWKRFRESGGGALLDLGSHHIDLVRHIFQSEIAEVFATVGSIVTEHDYALVELTTETGVHVQSFFSLNSANEDKLEIYGTSGKLTADRYNSFNVEITHTDTYQQSRFHRVAQRIESIIRSPVLMDRILATGKEPSFETALGHFASAILNNRPVSPDFTDGYASLAVIEAAEQSPETGRAIALDHKKHQDRAEFGTPSKFSSAVTKEC